jgi:hypothetical protein
MRSLLVGFSVTCLLLLGGGGAALADTVFSFQFDQTPDVTLTPPIVGAGTFSFTTDPGDGTFPLTALGALDISFTVGGTTYTEEDIDPLLSLDEVLVILSTTGAERRLQFSNTDPLGAGSAGGSFGFINVDFQELVFEPPGTSLVLYAESSLCGLAEACGTYFATAAAVAVPQPSTVVLVGTSLAAFLMGASVTRRRGP